MFNKFFTKILPFMR